MSVSRNLRRLRSSLLVAIFSLGETSRVPKHERRRAQRRRAIEKGCWLALLSNQQFPNQQSRTYALSKILIVWELL